MDGRGRTRWGRVIAGVAVIVFLALPCLLAAVAVMVGGHFYQRSNAVGAGRAPGTLTFDAARERYTIALGSELDGGLGGLFEGLSRTERRQRFRVYEGEPSKARCSIAHPDGSTSRVRGDRQVASTTVGAGYATVGEFEGKGGSTTVECRFDPADDLLGNPTETPLIVHAAGSLRYVGWGLFAGAFVLAGAGVLLILWGTVWRGRRRG